MMLTSLKKLGVLKNSPSRIIWGSGVDIQKFTNSKKEKLQLILNERDVFIHVLKYFDQRNILALWNEIAENAGKTYKINLDHKQLLLNIFLQTEKLLKNNWKIK